MDTLPVAAATGAQGTLRAIDGGHVRSMGAALIACNSARASGVGCGYPCRSSACVIIKTPAGRGLQRPASATSTAPPAAMRRRTVDRSCRTPPVRTESGGLGGTPFGLRSLAKAALSPRRTGRRSTQKPHRSVCYRTKPPGHGTWLADKFLVDTAKNHPYGQFQLGEGRLY